jgi:hypothetical protein
MGLGAALFSLLTEVSEDGYDEFDTTVVTILDSHNDVIATMAEWDEVETAEFILKAQGDVIELANELESTRTALVSLAKKSWPTGTKDRSFDEIVTMFTETL